MVQFDIPDEDDEQSFDTLLSASQMLALPSDEQRVQAVKRVWQDEDQSQINAFFTDYQSAANTALQSAISQIQSGTNDNPSVTQHAQACMAIFSMIAHRIPIASAQPAFIPVFQSLIPHIITLLQFDVQTVNQSIRESLIDTHCYILHALARSFEAFHGYLTNEQMHELAHCQSVILHSCVNGMTDQSTNQSTPVISPRLAAVTISLVAFAVIKPHSLSHELSHILKHLLRLIPVICSIDRARTAQSAESDKRVISSIVELTEAVITRCVVVVPRAYQSESSIKPPRWLAEDDEAEDLTPHVTYFLQPAHCRTHIDIAPDTAHHAITSFTSSMQSSENRLSDELFAAGLDLLPLLVALSNAHHAHTHDGSSHVREFTTVTNACLAFLEQPNASWSKIILQLDCLSGAIQLSDRTVILSHLTPVYERVAAVLPNIQSRASQSRTTQKQWPKARRAATSTVLSLMYAFDTEFGAMIGWPAFFSRVFPVLASPALPTHALWLLRNDRQLMVDVVLPQVMRALIHSQLRTSPTVKTIVAILESIGDAICFTHACIDQSQEDPLKPYLEEIVATLLNTLRGSPSSLGVSCTQAIARLLYHCCSVRLVSEDDEDGDEWFRECFSSLVDVMDETVFASAEDPSDDELSEEEVDLVSQARICAIQSAICLMSNPAFIESIASSDAAQQVMFRLVDHVVVSIGEAPMMFEDDEAIMHQQIDLLQTSALSIINHPSLRHKISVIDQMIQLFKSSQRLPADEQLRIEHIHKCVSSVAKAINECEDQCLKQQLGESLQFAGLDVNTFDLL